MVCRRYYGHNLRTVKKLVTKVGAKYRDGIHFAYQGGQIRSLLSLLSYLGSGEYREKYLGIKIPPTNLQDHHLQEARKFADGLASRLASKRAVYGGPEACASGTSRSATSAPRARAKYRALSSPVSQTLKTSTWLSGF